MLQRTRRLDAFPFRCYAIVPFGKRREDEEKKLRLRSQLLSVRLPAEVLRSPRKRSKTNITHIAERRLERDSPPIPTLFDFKLGEYLWFFTNEFVSINIGSKQIVLDAVPGCDHKTPSTHEYANENENIYNGDGIQMKITNRKWIFKWKTLFVHCLHSIFELNTQQRVWNEMLSLSHRLPRGSNNFDLMKIEI